MRPMFRAFLRGLVRGIVEAATEGRDPDAGLDSLCHPCWEAAEKPSTHFHASSRKTVRCAECGKELAANRVVWVREGAGQRFP